MSRSGRTATPRQHSGGANALGPRRKRPSATSRYGVTSFACRPYNRYKASNTSLFNLFCYRIYSYSMSVVQSEQCEIPIGPKEFLIHNACIVSKKATAPRFAPGSDSRRGKSRKTEPRILRISLIRKHKSVQKTLNHERRGPHGKMPNRSKRTFPSAPGRRAESSTSPLGERSAAGRVRGGTTADRAARSRAQQ